MNRPVETIYGPAAGCPDCGVIVIAGTHVCEHGVTAVPAEFEINTGVVITDHDYFLKLVGKDEPC